MCAAMPASGTQNTTPAVLLQVLLENMTVCGGGSALAGLKQRLLREVRALAPASWNPNIFAKPPYLPDHTLQHAAWVGGAILSKVRSAAEAACSGLCLACAVEQQAERLLSMLKQPAACRWYSLMGRTSHEATMMSLGQE